MIELLLPFQLMCFHAICHLRSILEVISMISEKIPPKSLKIKNNSNKSSRVGNDCDSKERLYFQVCFCADGNSLPFLIHGMAERPWSLCLC